MKFEFRLPERNEMRKTVEGTRMLRICDDDNFSACLITGCAGSGKTTVAIHRFIRLCGQRKKVLFLTFQNMLTVSVRNTLNAAKVFPDNIMTFHKWYYEYTDEFFNLENPPTVDEMKNLLNKNKPHYDEIILDEGQDLPPCVFEILPLYCDRFFVGADDAQQVYPDRGTKVNTIREILKNRYTSFKGYHLTHNYRNTYEIFSFSRQFVPRTDTTVWDDKILERLKNKPNQTKPKVVEFNNMTDQEKQLRGYLNKDQGNVAILCPRGPASKFQRYGEVAAHVYNFVSNLGINATLYHNNLEQIPDDFERYVVTTFKSAKGLEFDTVIIPRYNFKKDIWQEWFVACTRARRHLIVFRDMANKDNDPIAQFDRDTYD